MAVVSTTLKKPIVTMTERSLEEPAQQTSSEIIYPESDGKPMAESTTQYRWIVKIIENLKRMYAERPDVFVAGDLLWYPVEGNNKISAAPDALVVFGRPMGDRGSYRTWDEEHIPPQVVFEIRSPSNTDAEMEKKLKFYERYGVEEYYFYDPETSKLQGWIRRRNKLKEIEQMQNWISPRLQIRFELGEELSIVRPDGEIFLTSIELDSLRQVERQRAEVEHQRAEAAIKQAEKLAAKLRELGIEPE